jgi:hypothetical protein
MLKTFTIRHLDLVRRETFDTFQTDPIQAGKNLVRLAGFYLLMGATADELKNLLLNRESDLSDLMIDNILKFAGLNKFTVDKASKQGAYVTTRDFILPPAKFPAGYRDIPVVGDMYWWWFGGKEDAAEKKKEQQKLKREERKRERMKDD